MDPKTIIKDFHHGRGAFFSISDHVGMDASNRDIEFIQFFQGLSVANQVRLLNYMIHCLSSKENQEIDPVDIGGLLIMLALEFSNIFSKESKQKLVSIFNCKDNQFLWMNHDDTGINQEKSHPWQLATSILTILLILGRKIAFPLVWTDY